jgi:hypothetical protein
MVIKMAMAVKLELIDMDFKEDYETGKNGIGSIEIDIAQRIIKIKYDDTSEWDNLIIPFDKLRSFNYKLKDVEGTKI